MQRLSLLLISLALLNAPVSTTSFPRKVSFERLIPRNISPKFSAFTKTKSATQKVDLGESISNTQNIRYSANISINGIELPVVLDTGSTDLWVIPPDGLGQFNDTNIPLALAYGDGSYGSRGTIGVSPFKFGPYSVERQAFLNANESTISSVEELGLYGILGLSFDIGTASPINLKIKSLYGGNAEWGASVLQNIFNQNPDHPNFIAIDLSRTEDLEDTNGGTFTIGEYDGVHDSVQSAQKLVQFPPGGSRWTTLLSGIAVDEATVSLSKSSVPSVPSGNLVVLLDTGAPNTYLPTSVLDAIFARIPGAAMYESDWGQDWALPCNTTAVVNFVFGGEEYPMHSLDLSTISEPFTDASGKEWIVCMSAFVTSDTLGPSSEFDVLLGATFLRNVYSVYDFGDAYSSSPPYIQLLSEVHAAEIREEVLSVRAKTLSTLPPEMDPVIFARSYRSLSSVDTTAAGPVSSSHPEGHLLGASEPAFSIKEAKTYIILGITFLTLNLLIGLILVGFAVRAILQRKQSPNRLVLDRSCQAHYIALQSNGREEGPGWRKY